MYVFLHLHLIRFVIRSDELLNSSHGRFAIGSEIPLLIPSNIAFVGLQRMPFMLFSFKKGRSPRLEQEVPRAMIV